MDKTPKRTDQCIRAINTVFSLGGREGVKKIAVLLIGEDNSWSDKATKAHVQEAKDNHVSILVITTGNNNFTRLHSLRNIASDDGKFFVLTSFKGLQPLSNDLSTGSCLREWFPLFEKMMDKCTKNRNFYLSIPYLLNVYQEQKKLPINILSRPVFMIKEY